MVELGIVADDFTGACDVAAAVTRAGLPASVLLDLEAGIPDSPCVVVALKSRTAPADEAVADSLSAAGELIGAGARRIYQKYCSTFDSTPEGNIGPVAEALMELLGAVTDLTTPATPEVGRTVRGGQLYVDGTPLSETSMRHHPLTPMTDSDLVRLLGRQTSRPVSRGPRGEDAAGHLVLDASTDEELDELARWLRDRAEAGHVDLWGGGAGLAAALARALATGASAPDPAAVPVPAGRRLVVAGSCSERTRAQVARFTGPSLRVAPGHVDEALDFLAGASGDEPALVHSCAAPEHLLPDAAAAVEETMAEVTRRAVGGLGVGQLMVAGGETSGAVCRALGLAALDVREHVGPGLAWCSPRPDPGLRVLLKSGNFGAEDLFAEAWL
jgi:uncharacterized protein YgbK (DUF1537 family)